MRSGSLRSRRGIHRTLVTIFLVLAVAGPSLVAASRHVSGTPGSPIVWQLNSAEPGENVPAPPTEDTSLPTEVPPTATTVPPQPTVEAPTVAPAPTDIPPTQTPIPTPTPIPAPFVDCNDELVDGTVMIGEIVRFDCVYSHGPAKPSVMDLTHGWELSFTGEVGTFSPLLTMTTPVYEQANGTIRLYVRATEHAGPGRADIRLDIRARNFEHGSPTSTIVLHPTLMSPTPTPEPTPTVEPTMAPTVVPTTEPTTVPTVEPTVEPTSEPTLEPTVEPTLEPTAVPTVEPTVEPTIEPTVEPTPEPTAEPTVEPTTEPTVEPTTEPTAEPTLEPTAEPTAEPTDEPTVEPVIEPTVEPTTEPTVEPTTAPTSEPTAEPTLEPTVVPTSEPTLEPTTEPTIEPTAEPTKVPTAEPTLEPTMEPTSEPTAIPTEEPTSVPTVEPTATELDVPVDLPATPTAEPTETPEDVPVATPTPDEPAPSTPVAPTPTSIVALTASITCDPVRAVPNESSWSMADCDVTWPVDAADSIALIATSQDQAWSARALASSGIDSAQLSTGEAVPIEFTAGEPDDNGMVSTSFDLALQPIGCSATTTIPVTFELSRIDQTSISAEPADSSDPDPFTTTLDVAADFGTSDVMLTAASLTPIDVLESSSPTQSTGTFAFSYRAPAGCSWHIQLSLTDFVGDEVTIPAPHLQAIQVDGMNATVTSGESGTLIITPDPAAGASGEIVVTTTLTFNQFLPQGDYRTTVTVGTMSAP